MTHYSRMQEVTNPGCFPFSKLPNKLSICKAFAPLMVAQRNNCSVVIAGKCLLDGFDFFQNAQLMIGSKAVGS